MRPNPALMEICEMPGMYVYVDDDVEDAVSNPSRATWWVVGLGLAALAIGGTVLYRKVRASKGNGTLEPDEPIDPGEVIPQIDMAAAEQWLNEKWPAYKDCYREGTVRGWVTEPNIGFHLRYKIYEYHGAVGDPKWVSTYAWESPTGHGSGLPIGDDVQTIWDSIVDIVERGRSVWDAYPPDIRGQWESFASGC